MDSFSWERRSEILSFEEKAQIRSAIKKLHAFDDDYGCVAEGYGFDYWFYQFKFIYRLRNRKRASRIFEAIQRARKKYAKSKFRFEDMFGPDDPDDD